MRLNKFLARSGVASRRESDRLIQEATTTVNGILITDPAFNVEESDKVVFNGRQIVMSSETVVYVLNKPRGYITTMNDPQGRKTIKEFFPPGQRLFPIGRLDRNSTGIILLTNDGSLAQQLMLPKNRVPRIYEIEIDKALSQDEMNKMNRGIFIGFNQWGQGKVLLQRKRNNKILIKCELLQGKNRELRRIMAVLKRKVFSLHRIQYGTIALHRLPTGEYRRCSQQEIAQLQKAVPR